ncbi:MAG: glycosyltransferase [Bacteroidota bacterium]|nr:glycosyltransferase [Bacteroidota bacterium]MDP4247201.1 glycosyltransferase [Bacteroidota bacterium]MDP4258858.1 glycosyltransferase [Bacteroidota bacterium]
MATVLSIVSYPFLPARVGGQKGVALFYKWFSRFQRVVCVTTEKNDPAAAEGYTVLNVLSNSRLRYINPFYFFTLRKIAREQGATHLILEHPYFGWLGVWVARACGLRLVVHSHNMEGLRWKSLGKWWWNILWHYEKWVHRRADYNFFIHAEDMQYALGHFGLRPERCIVMTYGIEWDRAPGPEEVRRSRELLRREQGIAEHEVVLFFNGAFDHRPNLLALESILDKINPILLRRASFAYKILICGRGIPESMMEGGHRNVIWGGFVPDISAYFRGADVFINPVTEGGGIKTKLVEALGNNLTSVSVRNGALGVDPAWCGGKLLIGEDGDWEGFVDLIEQAIAVRGDVPAGWFDHFYWGVTTRRAAAFIEGQGRGEEGR